MLTIYVSLIGLIRFINTNEQVQYAGNAVGFSPLAYFEEVFTYCFLFATGKVP
jgi:hypothetical protein